MKLIMSKNETIQLLEVADILNLVPPLYKEGKNYIIELDNASSIATVYLEQLSKYPKSMVQQKVMPYKNLFLKMGFEVKK